MVKGFTPLVGLAVVVALALAAVFGSMSLANPAMAQETGPEITGLTVTNVTATTVSLSWDSLEDHTNEHYRAQWTKQSGGVTRASNEVTSSGSAPFEVTVADDTTTATITAADNTNGLAFAIGDLYTIQVQSRVGNVSGPYASVKATPNHTPDGALSVTAVETVDGSPGSVELSWTLADGTNVAAADVTGWQYRTAEYTDTDPATAGDYTNDTLIADSESEWMALTVSDGDGSADDPFKGTVSGLAAKIYQFQVRAMNGQALPTDVAFAGTGADANTVMSEASPDPRLATPMVSTEAGDGRVMLDWNRVANTHEYEYVVKNADGDVVQLAMTVPFTQSSATVTGLTNGVEYTFEVTAKPAAGASYRDSETAIVMETPVAAVIDVVDDLPSFEQSSTSPGDNANYDVKFQVNTDLGGSINTRNDDLIIEFHGDYGVPSTMRNTSVAVTTQLGSARTVTFTPEDVTVDGEKILISLGDMDERDDMFDYEIDPGEVINVHFRQSAGITTPTEAGGYELVAIEFGDYGVEYNDGTKDGLPNLEQSIYRKISLSEEDGGLDTAVEAKGSGFKNGTSLTVFLDKAIIVTYDDDGDDETDPVRLTVSQFKKLSAGSSAIDGKNVPFIYIDDEGNPLTTVMVTENGVTTEYVTAPNGTQQSNEDTLCVAASIGGDDIGRCEFKVTHPTFVGGVNYVNARDGRSQHSRKADAFELKASIIATPTTASPGERILVQVVDFPANTSISEVQLARNSRNPIIFTGGSVDGAGAGTLSFIVPNWPSAGTQELKVFGADGVNASVNVTIGGPQIMVTPGTVLANQRISLIGTGFSPRKVIANADIDAGDTMPIVTIGGKPISSDRINDGEPVRVDNGGNWSASVDLPLAEATTGEGERLIRVTDSGNRTGGVRVTIPARSVTITPESGRVGTIALIEGSGFPSKNDEGDSFSIQVVYETASGQTTRSATPDASGRFEVQLKIPTTAAIPSSNTVKVSFTDADGVVVPMTIPHEVPEGIIELSVNSGGPGSTVDVMGEGFKSFVPIREVKIGTLDVTPSPKPSTDGNGMMNFQILIPGLDVGIQTIEVSVGQTTASVGFTVTESGINPGDIMPVAQAFEDLGDNLVSVWHFNNDTKIWSFYDPTLEEGNTLTHTITGEPYFIRIKSNVEVILNRDTRSLTCVNDNCWNPIVW